MPRNTLLYLLLILTVFSAEGHVIVDSVSRIPLPHGAVYDRGGTPVAVSDRYGRLPWIAPDAYPLTVRYAGFKDKTVSRPDIDTLLMQEEVIELSEVVVNARDLKLLHMLAYVREYSTLSTYTDTVFLFREKMVDFMLPTRSKIRFDGWHSPRVLSSRSYYRFTNANGLDSVSDRCNHHFSWADWIGIAPARRMPEPLRASAQASDTLYGKYSPAEIWARDSDHLELCIDILADTAARRWVPNISYFIRDDVDFDRFRLRFDYDNIVSDSIAPIDLSGYAFDIESTGRGRGMFMFNRINESFCVSTSAEVYMVDKEYITLKEARKWVRIDADTDHMDIYEPMSAPPLRPDIMQLVDRVESIDHELIRMALPPDERLKWRGRVKINFGQQVLKRLKGMLGIDHINARRKWGRQWREFRRDRTRHNQGRAD